MGFSSPKSDSDVVPDKEPQIETPETMERTPVRPLGDLSTYTATALPADLVKLEADSSSGAELVASFESLAERAESSLDGLEESHVPLALFDASMLESVVRNKLPGQYENAPKVRSLLSRLAEHRGIAPIISYEGLIYANPLQTDPRTFLSGKAGSEEISFYQIHMDIEKVFLNDLPQLRELIMRNPRDLTPEEFIGVVDASAIPMVQSVSDHMNRFRDEVSANDTFDTVRPFWSASDDYQGPSGKFSSSYFVMDAYVCGNQPEMIDRLQQKLREREHNPQTTLECDGFAGQQDMVQSFALVQDRKDLIDIANILQNEKANAKLRELLDLQRVNRAIHVALAKRYLEHEFENNESGTGGEPMKKYLLGFHDAYVDVPKHIHAN